MMLTIKSVPAVTKVVTVTPSFLTMKEGTLTFTVHQSGDYMISMGDIQLYASHVSYLDGFNQSDYTPDRTTLSLLVCKNLADYFYTYIEARLGYMPEKKTVMMVKAIRATVVMTSYMMDDSPF